MSKILLVEDEEDLVFTLVDRLRVEGYQVETAGDGEAALGMAAHHAFDLVILDVGLPDLDGIEVTRLLRRWTQLPIIVLSVRDQERDKIAALDAGADDYLTKPFGVGELLARIRVALRRSYNNSGTAIFTNGDLIVDFGRRLITVSGREVQLTPTEYDLLRLMVTHAGKVLTHQQLLQTIWGADYSAELHMLRVNISNLRRKLEPDPARPRYVITEPGVGYRLRAAA